MEERGGEWGSERGKKEQSGREMVVVRESVIIIVCRG